MVLVKALWNFQPRSYVEWRSLKIEFFHRATEILFERYFKATKMYEFYDNRPFKPND